MKVIVKIRDFTIGIALVLLLAGASNEEDFRGHESERDLLDAICARW
jgi:hypothetical protein